MSMIDGGVTRRARVRAGDRPGPRSRAAGSVPIVHVAGVALLTLGVAACSSNEPQPVLPGRYQLYATSTGTTPGADLVVEDSTITMSVGPVRTQVGRTSRGREYLLCPPSGRGTPEPLDGSLTVGDLTLAQPAIYGDCGATKPARITVVDLASLEDGSPLPFQRWAEFCDVTDPDCR